MSTLFYQGNQISLDDDQSNAIQSGFYKSDENRIIKIDGAFDLNLVNLFLGIIKDGNELQNIQKNKIYNLFLLSKTWGIEEFQDKFGILIFGPKFKSDIQHSYHDNIKENIIQNTENDNYNSCKIQSLIFQAEIEFSSFLNEKCLVDVLDDKNPWFYQSHPKDSEPFVIIYFKDGSHSISNYSITVSKLPISWINSKSWVVEGLLHEKKKQSTWKKIDTVIRDERPKLGETIDRNLPVTDKFSAIKISSRDKKLSFHSITLNCDPVMKI